MNGSPEGNVIESVTGLKDNRPAKDMAVTTVGEAKKFMVRLLPSFLALKFLWRCVGGLDNNNHKHTHRLNDVNIAGSNINLLELKVL